MADPRVPVTLLTGFLGAGKTTLLNAVLSDNSAGRVAVIVNEFGEAGLDHDLIEESSEEIILMRSGCLCCSVRGDLSQTISDLFERRVQNEVAFERIVIETTWIGGSRPDLADVTGG
jgi:G3E family GTPase